MLEEIRVTRRDLLRGAGTAAALTLSFRGSHVSRARGEGRCKAVGDCLRRPLLRELGGRLPAAMDLGSHRQGDPFRQLLLPTRLLLERLREGRCRLSRGAGGNYPQTNEAVARLQPPRLPKGGLLQRAHVRFRPAPLPAEARRRSRRRQLEAGELGRGAPRIADRSIDVLSTDGPAGIIWDPGGANQHGCDAIGLYRTGFVLDTPVLAINQEVGDHHPGTTVTCGKIIFSGSGWYEKDDITWATPIAPFAHALTRATDPLAESKTDWEFHCLYLKAISQRAAARGVLTFDDRRGEKRRLDRVYDDFTFGRRYTEDNPEDLLEEIFSIAGNVGGTTWKEIKQKGFERYTGIGMSFSTRTNATDIEPGETITANTWHTRDKMPWPTLTRRLQFYIDDDALHGTRRGAAHSQGQPANRWQLSTLADGWSHEMVDSWHVAGPIPPDAPATRRAAGFHGEGRRGGPRYSGRGSGSDVERRRFMPIAGPDLAGGAPGAGDRVPRLGTVPVQESAIAPCPLPEPA